MKTLIPYALLMLAMSFPLRAYYIDEKGWLAVMLKHSTGWDLSLAETEAMEREIQNFVIRDCGIHANDHLVAAEELNLLVQPKTSVLAVKLVVYERGSRKVQQRMQIPFYRFVLSDSQNSLSSPIPLSLDMSCQL